MKRCTKCKEQKPATDQHFVGDPSKPDGLDSWCLACFRNSDAKQQKAHWRTTQPKLKADGKP